MMLMQLLQSCMPDRITLDQQVVVNLNSTLYCFGLFCYQQLLSFSGLANLLPFALLSLVNSQQLCL